MRIDENGRIYGGDAGAEIVKAAKALQKKRVSIALTIVTAVNDRNAVESKTRSAEFPVNI